ncbi:MAG: BACON domain-containing protein [Bryobacteraceae bacterium]
MKQHSSTQSTAALHLPFVALATAACYVMLGSAVSNAAPSTGDAFARIPVYFEPLQGSDGPGRLYVTRRSGMTAYLTPSGSVTTLHGNRSRESAAVGMTLEGAEPARSIQALDKQPGVSHYYKGNDPSAWRTNVPHYGRVEMKGVYDGIDLIYHGAVDHSGRLEYDFVVAPHADPGAIRMRFDGSLPQLTAHGDLRLPTAVRDLYHRKPALYQIVAGRQVSIAGGYRILPDGTVGFVVGAYRRDLPLVIDPVVTYSTYLGGALSDEVTSLAVAGTDVIVTGSTDSADFAIGTRAGETDVFVARLTASGTLLYSVLFGGNLADFGSAVAFKPGAVSEVIVAGSTLSTSFPGTAGSFQAAQNGSFDAFVTRLNASTGQLIRSTFYGGSGQEEAKGVAISSTGTIVVAGNTFSSDLPLANAIDSTASSPDGFLARFSADLTTLQFGSYFGGGSAEFVNGMTLDSSGRAVIGGQTYSSDLPVQSALQSTPGTLPDGFVAVVDMTAKSIVNSTYLGGSEPDSVQDVDVDASGAIYATGFTQSPDFPTTAGAWMRAAAGEADAFAVKLTGATLNFGTLIGGSGSDNGAAVAAGPGGVVAVAVKTLSVDFPTVAASQIRPVAPFPDRGDVIVATLNPSGNVIYSTYHSGGLDDAPLTMAYGPSGVLYVGGRTSSTDFPLVAAADSTYAGFSEGFVAALSPGPAPVAVTFESSPTGRRVIVDDVTHTTPVTLQWQPGVQHRVDAEAAAFSPPNQTFAWASWTGLAAPTPRQQTVTAPASPATYTANYNTLTCTYSVTPAAPTIGTAGGPVTLTVTTAPGCPWSASSSTAWIQGQAAGKTGNGTVTFTVGTAPGARTGSVEVAFQQVTISQAAGVPSVSGVSPASGSASSQSFAFTFQDPDGASDLDIVNVLVNNAIDGRQACYLAYVVSGPGTGSLILVNDAGAAGGPFAGTLPIPGAGSISNGSCTVNGAGSSASMNGNVLTLTLNLSFKTSFGGNRVIYQAARDKGGLNSGWTARGVWQVPGAGATSPSVVSLTPGRAAANSVVLSATFRDNDGFTDLNILNILINNAIDGRSACYVAIVRASNTLILVNDAGDAGGPFAGTTIIPSVGAVANSQCSINAAGSTVSGSGTTVTVTLSLTFLTPFKGDRIVYLAARDTVEHNSGWQPMATITVP